jgi:hypothetical protein
MNQYPAVLSMTEREKDHTRTDIISRNSVALNARNLLGQDTQRRPVAKAST